MARRRVKWLIALPKTPTMTKDPIVSVVRLYKMIIIFEFWDMKTSASVEGPLWGADVRGEASYRNMYGFLWSFCRLVGSRQDWEVSTKHRSVGDLDWVMAFGCASVAIESVNIDPETQIPGPRSTQGMGNYMYSTFVLGGGEGSIKRTPFFLYNSFQRNYIYEPSGFRVLGLFVYVFWFDRIAMRKKCASD